MKLSYTSRLLVALPIILAMFLCVETSNATEILSVTNLTDKTTASEETRATDITTITSLDNPNTTRLVPTSQEAIDSASTEDNFFVKIGDQVVPIDYTIFSSRKTLIKYTSNSDYYPEIENIRLCPEDPSNLFTVCDQTTSLQNRLNIHRETVFKINKVSLTEYLTSLKESSKKIAKNAKLSADVDGNITVLKKEQDGYEIDIDKILEKTLDYFSSSPKERITKLPVKITSPAITSTNYKKLGLKERIGTGKSNFRGSPKNRIHNIHNATDKFEGIIIAPDEIFSFVENLGDVDENTGYKEELVIKNNETIPEFGGGICQVSTTMFRSAVNTGLEITERRNHAYPVQYYSPQGTDATIYIPKPDLQFKNNTSKYIMLQPHIEGTVLTFDILGTSDGREVITEGPILLESKDNGDKRYVWWQIVNDKDGNQVSRKGFWSYYQNEARFHDNHEDQIHRKKPKGWSSGEWKRYKKEFW